MAKIGRSAGLANFAEKMSTDSSLQSPETKKFGQIGHIWTTKSSKSQKWPKNGEKVAD